KATLKEILHNYAFFDISTIDRFTHRLIRTFAKDLKLPQNFEVVLDTDLLLEEAVARLVQKAGTDKKLTGILLDFALEKIDDDKSWDIAFDLFNIGKLLFNETHVPHLENLREKDIDDFLGLKKILYRQRVAVGEQLTSTAGGALRLMDENGLEASDFTGRYFPKFLQKIAGGDLDMDFKAGWKQEFDSATLYNKTAPDPVKTVLDRLHPEFTALFFRIKSGYYQLALLNNAYGNIVPLTVLNAIQQEVKALQAENEQLSISEFNTLISREIKNQPAPFIYERLGEKYRHYFIDEFQDTSMLQWNNLIPLIGNALESQDMQGRKGSLFLVGDAKQAIYRWRGGMAEQFLNLVNTIANPFVARPEITDLPVNYRSHEEIIRFNNDFFTTTSPFLHNDRYRAMFADGNRQGYNTKKGGQVQLRFIEEEDGQGKNEMHCEAVLKTILSITDLQYGYGDVCILVRGNKEGILLADYLTRQRIPVISSESLLLNSSAEVRFLTHLMAYAAHPQNREMAYEILSFLSSEKEDRHAFIFENLHRVRYLLRGDYGFDIVDFDRMSVYDTMEKAIKCFDLAQRSDAYITYFMDVVLQIEQKEGTGLQAFLAYWEKMRDRLGISTPPTIDAVRIMTIHKAKGLEFPIVIFPFANARMDYRNNDKKMWLPVDPTGFNDFGEMLVTEKKEVEHYGETAAVLYQEEEHKMQLDALNVLYVALTRAEKALYLISEKDLTPQGEPKMDRYSGLFIDYLKNKGLWKDHEATFTFGALEENTTPARITAHENIAYRYTFKDRSGFRILTKSGMLWDTEREKARSRGNLIHYIMGRIETERDIAAAFEHVLRNGDIIEEDVHELKKTIRQVMDHPQLALYYKEGNRVSNERDIITGEGHILRPDRVVFQKNRATLIDYKTGRPNPEYKAQLYSYSEALKDMGYEVADRIIVYMNETVQVERV
ncbi:MAG TPA: 3'-5' exonuclease, partial [Pricia sp.]|nr:3'-5' exonuclease [Pricia sp.]